MKITNQSLRRPDIQGGGTYTTEGVMLTVGDVMEFLPYGQIDHMLQYLQFLRDHRRTEYIEFNVRSINVDEEFL